jgi:thiol-disulfide isomerase/thioredoxin
MKKIRFFFLLIAYTMFYSMQIHAQGINFPNTLPEPRLEYAPATLKIQITGRPNDGQRAIVAFTCPARPIVRQEVEMSKDGVIQLTVPVLAISDISINTSWFDIVTILLPNRKTEMKVSFDDQGSPKIEVESNSIMLSYDEYQKMDKAVTSIFHHGFYPDYGSDANIEPKRYLNARFKVLRQIAQMVKETDNISDNIKYIIYQGFMGISYDFFSKYYYSKEVEKEYIKNHKNLEGFEHYPIDRSYYRFLKHFDLNNPKSLYSFFNSDIMFDMLADSVLNISEIGSMSLINWQTETKGIFNDLIGDNNQFFIDLLTLNAYSQQIQNSKPLSSAQIQDIKTYFTTGNLANFLLDENNNMLETLHRTSELHPLVINQTPESAKGELLKNIVAKYKGKVVFVDFWATWCGPCIAGMQLSKPVKSEYSQKDVAFVYIASTNSPEESWKNKIPQIGGEHYYLSMEKDDEIMDQYNFSTIPMYMIFDKEGNLLHQEGSISPAKMREWLDEALKK